MLALEFSKNPNSTIEELDQSKQIALQQGVKEQEVSSVPKMINFTANPDHLFIGREGNPVFPCYSNGTLDDLRIYNRALCGDDIKCLVN